ncbi:O-antigen polymerase [Neobacillus sp. 19]|uniref:O-antigen polymerase n=1 Tax=Neobacillus sp. 19 TaxID=3394458 RepID=UPI003BF7471D
MKDNNDKLGKLYLLFLYIILGAFLLFLIPSNLNNHDYESYLVLWLSYILVGGIFTFTMLIKKVDIIEPYVFVTIIFLIMFSLVPLINIVTNDTLSFGVNVMDSSIKATIVYVLSYISFQIAYFFKWKPKSTINNISSRNQIVFWDLTEKQKNWIYKICLVLWCLFYLFSLIYILSSGTSLIYIFTIGLAGSVNISNSTDTPLGFLGMFNYSLIPIWLYISHCGKNKLLNYILFYLTFGTFLVRGFRFVLVILIIAPFVFKYLKEGKRPNGFKISGLSVIIIFMIGLVGYVRDNLRVGQMIDWTNFNLEFIKDALIGNFNVYQGYYAIVKVAPDIVSFSGLAPVYNTIIMFIPRAIFPSKRYLDSTGEMTRIGISEYATQAGFAAPNLGEFYACFGLIGCIVGMIIFARFCVYIKRKYTKDTPNIHDLILYSVLFPSILQLIIRGYLPSNFYLILFLVIPGLFIKFILKGSAKDHD